MQKNYLIIGGSSGIGAAIVSQLSQQGHHVWATYHNHPQSNTSNITYLHWDAMNNETNLPELPDTIHGLVYCPGNINLKPVTRVSTQEMLNDYQLQVVGAVRILQQALPSLKRAGSASVVLFSTVAVQTGFSFHTIVSASKGAIQGLVRSWAAELAPIIRVNAIAPSITDTPLADSLLNTPEKKDAHAQRHPLKKIGKADELAQTAVFLMGENASWITGQILGVDGGMSVLK
jgi:NAD(P)-dependent dehydrogenase (short-subunit alcohol dehydrogenase family)